jgi:ferritin
MLITQRPIHMNRLLRYFKYSHLPVHLQTISKPFSELAEVVASLDGDPAEITAGLRKLLEAKDCAVRSMIPAEPQDVEGE